MIKSSKTTLKFANVEKRKQISLFIKEYKRVMICFIDIFWKQEKVSKFVDAEIYKLINTSLPARASQAAGQQAAAIVKGVKRKQEKRAWQINKFIELGMTEEAEKLQIIYDNTDISKPKIKVVEAQLDSRFVSIDLDNKTSFDGWLTFMPGDKSKIKIPFKRNKHFNRLYNKGLLKTSVRLSEKEITFCFDLPDISKKTEGSVIGFDAGQTTVASLSDGQVSRPNQHKQDLKSITTQMCKKKRGSKAFRKTQTHRKNYINWCINKLDLSEVMELRVEKIKNMRTGKRTSKLLSHWTYTEIFSKINDYCEEHGVRVIEVNPVFTSKRCSACGWTQQSNRKAKEFICKECGFTEDADINASQNIVADLFPIYYNSEVKHKLDIKTGFWWPSDGREPMIPFAIKKDKN